MINVNGLIISKFNKHTWAHESALLIQKNICEILAKRSYCNVFLTGGKTAELLYRAWSDLSGFGDISGVNFYFGDERCVPLNDPDSIYGQVMKSLFANGVPTGINIFEIDCQNNDSNIYSALKYEALLPREIDILLLTVGDDGHVASIFPKSELLVDVGRNVLPVTSPFSPFSRISITPLLIKRANKIYVLGLGKKKSKMLSLALQNRMEIDELPVRLTINSQSNWLISY